MKNKSGIAYIITNTPGETKKRFETLCNASIKQARRLGLRVALVSVDSQDKVNADYYIDAKPYLEPYIKQNGGKEMHGLISTELLKTHLNDWSPFDKTLYFDCDTILMSKNAINYLTVLDSGYELSMATCASMQWKDSIEGLKLYPKFLSHIPTCFPYWNFGIFGAKKGSVLLEKIREKYLKYCFGGWHFFSKSCPHAQPAIVQVAYEMSPDHKIFTMPVGYNAHFSIKGGYVFSGSATVFHMWKDIRNVMAGGSP